MLTVDILFLIAGTWLCLHGRGWGPVRQRIPEAGGVSATATLGAVGVSLAAIGYLAATDPKRRRAFRLGGGRRTAALPGLDARGARPGVLVPIWGAAAPGSSVWLGATATVGWLLVGMAPEAAGEALARPARGGNQVFCGGTRPEVT